MSLFGNSVLAGSAGQGPSADLGETIDQSLRFRGTQSLTKTLGTATTWTCSFWVKRSALSTDATGPQQTISFNNGVTQHRFQETNAFLLGDLAISSELFRDPSSWYHVVSRSNGSTSEAWINNKQLTFSPAPGARTGGGVTSIGIFSTTELDGYLAEVNFLETHLSPTDFARYNEDGVWVPKTPNFTAAQYGANGFRLTFDSSQTNAGIGEDSAPIGASGHTARNDFTASGFDTGDIVLYSQDVFGDNSSTYNNNNTNRVFLGSTFGPDKMFNGVLNDDGCKTGIGSAQTWLYWRPSGGLSISSSLTVTCNNTGAIRVNGVDQGLSNTSTSTLTISNPPATLTELAVQGNTISSATVMGVAVDGTTLVNNFDNDVDYLDTPTSNYATLNPVRPRNSNIAPQKANLRAFASSTADIWTMCSTQAIKHKAYMEVLIEDQHGGVNPSVGIVNGTLNMNQGTPYNKVGSYHYQGNGGGIHNGTNQGIVGQTWGTNGDVIGLIFDPDTGEFRTSVNGTISSVLFTLSASELEEDWFFQIAQYHGSLCDLNYGQKDFIYTPPTGFTGLHTNNLPEPTIKNGKEHFEAVTYTGNASGGTGSQNISLEFQPDLVWIKHRTSGYNNNLFDSIRGTSVRLRSNMANGDDSMTNGVTAFNSDGFTVGGNAGVNDNNNSYVAWCWKAGGTAVSNTDGTITSNVSANTDAGFSIVSYTGSGVNGTIGHGLSDVPDLVIYKRTNASNDWIIYSSELLATEYLILNNTAGKNTNNTNLFNSLRPTNSVLNVGTSGSSNALSQPYIAYCWHSVEGFSKFGKYTGNGVNNDGPFVYLGFRPALLVIRSLSGRPTMVYDSARNPTNPADLKLYWNYSQFENQSDTISTNIIDFLSNGFKLRHNSGQTNALNEQYIFMAWAENPFGGENAPPATAR